MSSEHPDEAGQGSQAEEALRERAAQLQSFLDHSSTIMFVKDLEGRYLFVNRQFDKLLPHGSGSVLGRTDLDIFPPEQAAAFLANDRKVLQELTPITFEEVTQHNDGPRTSLVCKFPLFDATGRPYAVGGIVTDITERKRTEEVLRLSVENLRLATGAARVGMWFWDLRTGNLEWTFICKALFGFPADQAMSYEVFLKAVHPDDRERTDLAIRHSLSTRSQYRIEYRTVWPDASVHWLVAVGQGCYDNQGQPMRMMGIVLDITERKRAEEDLREQKERFQKLAETISEVFWMSTRDMTEILYVSPAYETVWGRSCRSLYERPSSFLEAIHPDDRLRVQAEVREQQMVRGEPFAHEYRIVRPDGSIRWIWDRGFPILNKTGAVYRFAGIAEDITERRRTEDILRQKTEQLYAINGSLQRLVQFENWKEAGESLLQVALQQTGSEYGFIGVVVEGPVLRILAHAGIVWDQVENRELYEQAMRSYQEKGYLEFTNFNNLFGWAITEKQVVISNEPAADSRAGGLPTGHPPLRQFLGVPVLNGTTVVGIIGVANRAEGYTGQEEKQLAILAQAAGALFDGYRRQQEQERLEQQLRQAEKMAAMGMLIAGVSHEVNNPLFALSGYIELASERVRYREYEGLAEDIAAMREAVARATAMVQRFLGVARSPARQRELCAVNGVVEEGLELVANDCRVHGVEISRDLAPDLPRIEADPQELLQVMLNLFTNARQAMTEQGHGTLTVATSLAASPHYPVPSSASSGAWVEIRVQDDGPGIAPEHEGRIFEPFFTTKPVGEGTGLGLSISHRIVTEHGGAITCQNNPGRGTTFVIRLPAGTGDPQDAER